MVAVFFLLVVLVFMYIYKYSVVVSLLIGSGDDAGGH